MWDQRCTAAFACGYFGQGKGLSTISGIAARYVGMSMRLIPLPCPKPRLMSSTWLKLLIIGSSATVVVEGTKQCSHASKCMARLGLFVLDLVFPANTTLWAEVNSTTVLKLAIGPASPL